MRAAARNTLTATADKHICHQYAAVPATLLTAVQATLAACSRVMSLDSTG
jgi:hypothetical protein